jgi:MerR family transcriptional regulator/heat shock protein HspR
MKSRRKKGYTISAVAEAYDIHPQTLRLYERQGLLKPSRSQGNTRYYTEEDLTRLELILTLTRDLGVNLAGVEVILNMREKMDNMQQEIERFMESVRHEVGQSFATQVAERFAIVPVSRASIVRLQMGVQQEDGSSPSDGVARRKKKST